MLKKMSWLAIGGGLLLLLGGFARGRSGRSDFDTTRDLVAMRSVAHQVLLYTGDSTTTIPPVTRLSTDHYRISFRNAFAFRPDTLAHIIDEVVATDRGTGRYIVTVLEEQTDQVVYGYSMAGPHQQELVACAQRLQPLRRYSIDVRFQEGAPVSSALYMSGGGLLLIGLLLLGIWRYRRQPVTIAAEPGIDPQPQAMAQQGEIIIGSFLFHPEQQRLERGGVHTALTAKEARILHIFAREQDAIIDRRRLQKEIWEDEGVIVGRSLDMFISRLRRKLEADPAVRIVNIHGKGYKLEIGIDTGN